MRIILSTTLALIAVAIILAQAGITSALFRFVALGAIPGTNYSLSPFMMSCLVLAAIWLIVFTLAKPIARQRLIRN